ncbi:hypothetical protein LX36DRAFT_182607 [Colletotrichum falcatum]|nr:hypothetical protein LX36DRAFT_182607 [Colletotrichum falcatum]
MQGLMRVVFIFSLPPTKHEHGVSYGFPGLLAGVRCWRKDSVRRVNRHKHTRHAAMQTGCLGCDCAPSFPSRATIACTEYGWLSSAKHRYPAVIDRCSLRVPGRGWKCPLFACLLACMLTRPSSQPPPPFSPSYLLLFFVLSSFNRMNYC